MHKQSAFTLIEFVIVIVILGILSVFAITRFADLQDEAELATIEYVASSYDVGVKSVKTIFSGQGHTKPIRVR